MTPLQRFGALLATVALFSAAPSARASEARRPIHRVVLLADPENGRVLIPEGTAKPVGVKFSFGVSTPFGQNLNAKKRGGLESDVRLEVEYADPSLFEEARRAIESAPIGDTPMEADYDTVYSVYWPNGAVQNAWQYTFMPWQGYWDDDVYYGAHTEMFVPSYGSWSRAEVHNALSSPEFGDNLAGILGSVTFYNEEGGYVGDDASLSLSRWWDVPFTIICQGTVDYWVLSGPYWYTYSSTIEFSYP